MLKMVMAINTTYLPATGRTTPEHFKVSCETCHHGLNRPESLRNTLADAVEANGADSATTLYKALRAKYYGAAAYDFSENSLNLAAQEIARLKDQRPAALRLAQLNLEYYDKSAPTYQTIANLNLAAGDTAAAIAAINKAIALQPTNPQLQQMLQRMQPKPPTH
jgi:multidrug resistance efflux pump